MDALENSFLLLTLYHLLTSDDYTTEGSLRSIIAFSTFAFENVVRVFTRAQRTLSMRRFQR
jgi:hypothetical protein